MYCEGKSKMNNSSDTIDGRKLRTILVLSDVSIGVKCFSVV